MLGEERSDPDEILFTQRYPHNRKTTTDILAQGTSNYASTTSEGQTTFLRLRRAPGREQDVRDSTTVPDDGCDCSVEL